jgi:hypothetical protein
MMAGLTNTNPKVTRRDCGLREQRAQLPDGSKKG